MSSTVDEFGNVTEKTNTDKGGLGDQAFLFDMFKKHMTNPKNKAPLAQEVQRRRKVNEDVEKFLNN